MDEPFLHLYSQDSWHDDAWIAGDRQSLLNLRDAIDRALNDTACPGAAILDTIASDGEGYSLFVLRVDTMPDGADKTPGMRVPYCSHIAKDHDGEHPGPFDVAGDRYFSLLDSRQDQPPPGRL